MIRLAVHLGAALVLVLITSHAALAIDVYTDEATFLSSVVIESTEDFQSFFDGEELGLGQTVVDEVTYSIFGIPRNWFITESVGGNGLSKRLTATFPQPNEITFGEGLTQSLGFRVSAAPTFIPVQIVVTSSTGTQTIETFSEDAYYGFSTPEGIVSVLVESVGGGGSQASIAFDDVSRADIKIIPEPGDMNADGSINDDDINPFVLALTDRLDYQLLYPWIDVDATGDVNDSGSFDLGDVGDFKLLVAAQAAGQSSSPSHSSAAPEPGCLQLGLLLLGMLPMVRFRRLHN